MELKCGSEGLKTVKITANRKYHGWRYLAIFETVLRTSSSSIRNGDHANWPAYSLPSTIPSFVYIIINFDYFYTSMHYTSRKVCSWSMENTNLLKIFRQKLLRNAKHAISARGSSVDQQNALAPIRGNVRICQFMHSIFRFFDDI